MTTYAIQINSDTNRIEHATFSWCVTSANADKYIYVDSLPTGETEPEKDVTNYLYVDGEYVYDPKPEQPEPVEPETEATVWDELDAAYQEGVDSV